MTTVSIAAAFGLIAAAVVVSSCSGPTSTSVEKKTSRGLTSAAGLKKVAEFEGGVRYRTAATGKKNAFPVLSLKGSWHQMGRQYGRLMRTEMDDFYDEVVARLLTKERGVEAAAIDAQSDALFRAQSRQGKELIVGMASGAGFPLAKQKRIAAIVPLADATPGCSSMAAWGEYTGGGPLVVGRNWDIGGVYPGYRKYLSVAFFQPPERDVAFADVDFVGNIGFQTGMSISGLFLDLQNGMHSDPDIVESRPLPTLKLFELMATTSTMKGMDRFFMSKANSPMIAVIMNVADETEDRVYEWGTGGTKKRLGSGLMASSNHFVDPTWTGLVEVPKGAKGDWSRERLANLLALGNARKGKLNAEQMMRVLDTTFEKGGATYPEYTVYQVVAVPAERTLWLKARGYSDWEKIDLRALTGGN